MRSRAARTIDALEPAARWGIDIVTVRAEQLDGVHSGKVGTSAWDDVAAIAVYAGAGAKYASLVLVDLRRYAFAGCAGSGCNMGTHHRLQSCSCENETLMAESVQQFSRRLHN